MRINKHIRIIIYHRNFKKRKIFTLSLLNQQFINQESMIKRDSFINPVNNKIKEISPSKIKKLKIRQKE